MVNKKFIRKLASKKWLLTIMLVPAVINASGDRQEDFKTTNELIETLLRYRDAFASSSTEPDKPDIMRRMQIVSHTILILGGTVASVIKMWRWIFGEPNEKQDGQQIDNFVERKSKKRIDSIIVKSIMAGIEQWKMVCSIVDENAKNYHPKGCMRAQCNCRKQSEKIKQEIKQQMIGAFNQLESLRYEYLELLEGDEEKKLMCNMLMNEVQSKAEKSWENWLR